MNHILQFCGCQQEELLCNVQVAPCKALAAKPCAPWPACKRHAHKLIWDGSLFTEDGMSVLLLAACAYVISALSSICLSKHQRLSWQSGTMLIHAHSMKQAHISDELLLDGDKQPNQAACERHREHVFTTTLGKFAAISLVKKTSLIF